MMKRLPYLASVSHTIRTLPTQRQIGFTLIELLVAVVIGLLGVLVIFQVVSTWDSQRRTTTAGSDAQVGAMLGGFALERDVRNSGWGFGTADTIAMRTPPGPLAPSRLLGCTVTSVVPAGSFTMVPTLITQGAANAPDVVTVLSGNSGLISDRKTYNGGGATQKIATRESTAGIFPGDLLIFTADTGVGTPPVCQLVELTSIGSDQVSFNHATGSYTPAVGPARAAVYNPTSTNSALVGGAFFVLGTAPVLNQWSVRDGRALSFLNLLNPAATPVDVAEGVIDLQAQYGYDNATPMTGTVSAWFEPDALPAPTDWSRVIAIRIAILSRAQQFERTPVSTVAPAFFNGARSFTMRNVDGSADSNTANDPNNWRHYRYRVYEKVIPLRNMLWGQSP
jgi:type IV pilus assembly protein PilW